MRLAILLALALGLFPTASRASVHAPSAGPAAACRLGAFVPAPLRQGGGSPVPEPSTLLLVGTGLVGVAITARLRRRRR